MHNWGKPMIAETLAGIALVKSSVDAIKSVIDTSSDIGEIAGFIDKIFEGEKQIQQERSRKQYDPFSIGNVAKETIDARLAQEHLREIATMVDLRFGPGTWAGIISERAKRIQEAREAAAEARRESFRRHEELMEQVKVGGIALACVAFALLALLLLFNSTPAF